jgi:hypothetical protein
VVLTAAVAVVPQPIAWWFTWCLLQSRDLCCCSVLPGVCLQLEGICSSNGAGVWLLSLCEADTGRLCAACLPVLLHLTRCAACVVVLHSCYGLHSRVMLLAY